jgi:DNA-directed RNA polymerase specialized sigma24 family protein
MATQKKSKAANDSTPLPFATSLWASLFGLADDTRAESHKQLGALIGFVDGALQGATGYATKLNDRADRLVQDALLAADQSGREFASGGQQAVRDLAAWYRNSASQLATSSRESARSVADRASATAQAMVTPSKKPASSKQKKAA